VHSDSTNTFIWAANVRAIGELAGRVEHLLRNESFHHPGCLGLDLGTDLRQCLGCQRLGDDRAELGVVLTVEAQHDLALPPRRTLAGSFIITPRSDEKTRQFRSASRHASNWVSAYASYASSHTTGPWARSS
jgi:hypothetical protein